MRCKAVLYPTVLPNFVVGQTFFCRPRWLNVGPAGMWFGSEDAASCQNERSKVFNNSGGASRWRAASCQGRCRWPADGDNRTLLRYLLFYFYFYFNLYVFGIGIISCQKTADHTLALGRSWRELASWVRLRRLHLRCVCSSKCCLRLSATASTHLALPIINIRGKRGDLTRCAPELPCYLSG